MTRAVVVAGCATIVLVAASVFAWRTESSPAEAVKAQMSGGELFHSKGCASCHNTSTSVALISGFPSLIGASEWAGDRRPGMSQRAYLAESMRTPGAFISPAFEGGVGPTAEMPTLALTEAEIDALVDYLLQG